MEIKVIKTKFVGIVATSIDGRISQSKQSSLPWTSKEDWNFLQKTLQDFDAVIVGHNTYKVAEKNLKKRNTIVFSSQKHLSRGTVKFFNPKQADIKLYIKEKRYKKVAILGGPKVYNFFLENKMLDQLFVTIEPYVFTTGVPMFTGDKFSKHKFTLLFVKKLNKNGTLLLKYKYGN